MKQLTQQHINESINQWQRIHALEDALSDLRPHVGSMNDTMRTRINDIVSQAARLTDPRIVP